MSDALSISLEHVPELNPRRPWRTTLVLGETRIESFEAQYHLARSALLRSLEKLDGAVMVRGAAEVQP